MDQFKHYIDQIPKTVYHNAKVYEGKHVALLMPKEYMSDTSILTEDYHIVLPVENPPPIMIERKEYNFTRNKIIAFNPDIMVYCAKNMAVTSGFSTITIKKKFLNEVADDMGYPQKIIFSNVENPFSSNIKQVISNFKQEIDNYGNSSSMLIDSHSIQIAATMLREIKSNVSSREDTVIAGDGYVRIAQDYMREFYNSDISIKDICQEIHITPYHFIRLFKEKTGMTPHEYLLKLRIENAKKLLKNNEGSITSIGNKCGFVNNAHFSTAFKRVTGVSPVEYKRTPFPN